MMRRVVSCAGYNAVRSSESELMLQRIMFTPSSGLKITTNKKSADSSSANYV
jgi:hypothetical protein